jgi:hypothetical protein
MPLATRTSAKPTTEITVSMIDQLLIVSATDMPKNSLTSQNPASLTCEKNSEPQPTRPKASAYPAPEGSGSDV